MSLAGYLSNDETSCSELAKFMILEDRLI